jgi:hypothetical protein
MGKISRSAAIAIAMAIAGGVCYPAFGGWQDTLKGVVEGAKEAVGPAGPSGAQGGLGADEIGQGLREALRIGAEKATSRASAVGGFLENPQIRIPLPGRLQKVGDMLRTLGMGSQVTAFEETMNRAAEKAAAKAFPIFGDAVAKLTFADVQKIWKGGDTAATDYLQKTTRDKLYKEFRPVVHDAAQSVGVTRSYEELTGRPEVAAFASGGDLDLDHYVTDKALDGLFTLVGEEEKQIRTNPIARTTDLLKKVFSK